MKISDKHDKVVLKKQMKDELKALVDENIQVQSVVTIKEIINEHVAETIHTLIENDRDAEEKLESLQQMVNANSSLIFQKDADMQARIHELKMYQVDMTSRYLKEQATRFYVDVFILLLMVSYFVVVLAYKFKVFG